MQLEPPVFRPPSEAFSLILQLTIGCQHNACTFCGAYKGKTYRSKDWAEIKKDIDDCAMQMSSVDKVFLADGDALATTTPLILKTTHYLYKKFSGLERVSMYAGPKDILQKSLNELKEIRAAGVKMLYMGVESGSDTILQAVKKGVTASEMIEAGRKALQAGFKLSVTVINGLGGTKMWREHAIETGKVLTAMDPTYLAALTLMVLPDTPLYRQVQRGSFIIPDTIGILQEIKLILEHTNLTNCIFRTNHASNYLPLSGTLSKDKNALISLLDRAITNPAAIPLRPEHSRRL